MNSNAGPSVKPNRAFEERLQAYRAMRYPLDGMSEDRVAMSWTGSATNEDARGADLGRDAPLSP